MRNLLVLSLVGLLTGCAQTMVIDQTKLKGETASLIIDASTLEGFVTIPLMKTKSVNVFLSEFPDCKDGKPVTDKSKKLGKATLTPKKHTQELRIPANSKLLVSTNSQESVAGNQYTCWNSLHFTPANGGSYTLKVVPHQHKAFSTEECSTQLLEVIDGETAVSSKATYPDVKYMGFWTGKAFNHCEKKSD